MNRKIQIGIMGYCAREKYPEDAKINSDVYTYAYEIGKYCGEHNFSVVTGGMCGVMTEAAKGCKDGGGITVGVIAGKDRFVSNEYIDVEVVTGAYFGGEEMTLITMCDAIIVLGGASGTLHEIVIAYRLGKPIFALKNMSGWSEKLESIEHLDDRKKTKIQYFDEPKELFAKLKSTLLDLKQ